MSNTDSEEDSHGLPFGFGVYDVMRIRRGHVEFAELHVRRFLASARELGLALSSSPAQLHKAILERPGQEGRGEGLLQLLARHDHWDHDLSADEHGEGAVEISTADLPAYSRSVLAQGFQLVTNSFPRNQYSPLCGHKTLSRLEDVLAQSRARDQGADQALMLNTKSRVTGTSNGNVFLIHGRELITPPLNEGAFPGVMRQVVMTAAAKLGMNVVERAVPHDELATADDVFWTNSLIGIAAVATIDGRRLPSPPKPLWVPPLRLAVHQLSRGLEVALPTANRSQSDRRP